MKLYHRQRTLEPGTEDQTEQGGRPLDNEVKTMKPPKTCPKVEIKRPEKALL